MSTQDFPRAPFPFAASTGDADALPMASAVGSGPPRERYWLYGLLFTLTVLSTSLVGAAMQFDFDRNVPFGLERSFELYPWFWQHPAELVRGLPFSFTLLTILLAHEFGHYLAAVYHGVDASLPYFMPSPVLGTFGAFIRVRSPIYSKRVLFDIGIAGPLAGFVFLLPALAVGISLSKAIPGIGHQGSIQFGTPGLEWLLGHAMFPAWHSSDLYLHPVARGAWMGMFATAMNLLPVGQLDGGHILYSFFPRLHRLASTGLSLALLSVGCVAVALNWLALPMGRFFWPGWAFWGAVLLLLGRRHPLVYDSTPLDRGRRRLGWIALAVFVLCFTLVPFADGGL
ncbi:MAG: site-2 protease family protein [Bryobacteraceae bacterium]